MRDLFDRDGSVFKQTKNAGQFLKQGEIDVVGLGQNGSVHALDVAFHEAGLNYGGGADKRVLKKLLRAVMILKAYHASDTELHVYFVSPKVHRAVQQPLEDIFTELEGDTRNRVASVDQRRFCRPGGQAHAGKGGGRCRYVRVIRAISEVVGVGWMGTIGGGGAHRGRVVAERAGVRYAATESMAEENVLSDGGGFSRWYRT